MPQQIRFKHYNVEDGLSQSVVNCMIEDHTGFLWFGTQDGLNRFDGYNFRIFRHNIIDTGSLSDNDIWSLFEDEKGNIWVGTQDGILNCFDPSTETFAHYKIDSTNSVRGNSITCIYQDKSDIFWIGTYKGGLYRFDKTSGSIINWNNEPGNLSSLSNKYVTTIFEDYHGNLWIGTYNGLCLFNKSPGHPSHCFFHDQADINSIPDNIIWRVFQSPTDSDNIWIGTYNGLAYLNIKTKIIRQVIPDENNPEQFSRSISSICEDFNGNHKYLWLGTYEGLLRVELPKSPTPGRPEKKGKGDLIRFISFKRWVNNPDNQYSINNNLINNVLSDRSGVIWIAGQKGIDYYAKQKDKFNLKVTHKYESTNLGKFFNLNIQGLCQTPDQTVWIGSSQGLYAIKNILQNYELTGVSQFLNQNIWSLAPGKNDDLWIGTYGQGLEQLELNTHKIRKWNGNWRDSSDIGNSYVRSLLQDEKGNVWIGLWGVGLNCLNPESGQITRWHHESENPQSISYDDIWVIDEDNQGRIWLGTYGGGLNLYNPSDGGTFYKWLSDGGTKNCLSNNNILSIHEYEYNKDKDKTILWIGTTDGLNKFIIDNNYTKNTKPSVKIERYLLRQDFNTNTINSIEEDRDGHLWITTNKGLIEFDPSAGNLDNYTISDGLQSNEFNPNSSCKTTDGKIIIGSVNGLNIFYPDSIYQSKYKPPVVLTEFQIFNQVVKVERGSPLITSIQNSKEINLSYDQNVFSFQFSSLDYNAPEMNQYAYWMEGFDKDWIRSGTRHYATYTNLDPGDYIFHVKATNSDGKWNNGETSIAVIIHPPFWETWWFRGFVILIITWSLYFIYRFRLKRFLEIERLRIKIASDLHDDIGSALTRISLESELLNSNIDPEENRAGLSRIGNMSREIISSMSDVVWSIDSRNDSIENLLNHMKDFAFSLFSLKNIQAVFETKNLDLQKKLKVDVRQNVYLIFKEAINNAVKYSNSKEIKIILKNEEKFCQMIIYDPGSTLSIRKLTGHGLRNMQMRADRIGGKIEFINEDGFKIVYTGEKL